MKKYYVFPKEYSNRRVSGYYIQDGEDVEWVSGKNNNPPLLGGAWGEFPMGLVEVKKRDLALLL